MPAVVDDGVALDAIITSSSGGTFGAAKCWAFACPSADAQDCVAAGGEKAACAAAAGCTLEPCPAKSLSVYAPP